MFERLKTGITLTVDSLRVMRNHPKLSVFPLVSAAAGLAFLVVFLGVTFGLMAITPEGGALVGLFLAYFGLTFVSSFFAAGLVHQTREALAGNDPTLRGGLEAAWSVKRPLLCWSFVAASVGIVINAIESSDSMPARIVGAIFGIAWTLLTFFVVPVIVFEGTGFRESFTESASTFKRTWGETPISLGAVQVLSTVVAIPFLLLGYGLVQVNVVIGAGAVVTGVFLSFLVGQTLQGIIKTTLYLYATEGYEPGEFENVDFDGLSGGRIGSTPTVDQGTPGRI